MELAFFPLTGLILLLTPLTSEFFVTVLPLAGVNTSMVNDELFDAFVIDNYIGKCYQCKQ